METCIFSIDGPQPARPQGWIQFSSPIASFLLDRHSKQARTLGSMRWSFWNGICRWEIASFRHLLMKEKAKSTTSHTCNNAPHFPLKFFGCSNLNFLFSFIKTWKWSSKTNESICNELGIWVYFNLGIMTYI